MKHATYNNEGSIGSISREPLPTIKSDINSSHHPRHLIMAGGGPSECFPCFPCFPATRQADPGTLAERMAALHARQLFDLVDDARVPEPVQTAAKAEIRLRGRILADEADRPQADPQARNLFAREACP